MCGGAEANRRENPDEAEKQQHIPSRVRLMDRQPADLTPPWHVMRDAKGKDVK